MSTPPVTKTSDVKMAAIIVGSICTIIITFAAAITGGLAVQTRYSPDEVEIGAIERRESRALARELLRPCAEAP